MAFTKKFTKEALILFLFLAFLPFGQILRLPISFLGADFRLNITDAVAFSGLLFVLMSKLKKPVFWKSAVDFLIVTGFSLVFSLWLFTPPSILLGIFYFVRLIAYFSLFLLLWNYFRKEKSFKEIVLRSLILSSGFVAIFGWLQYLFYPDLRSLIFLNWDDHLLRMVGGFLDPTFTGIILVFGISISLLLHFREKSLNFLFFILFLLVSLALTYSRASYLALAVSLGSIALLQKRFKEVIYIGLAFGLIILFLPKGVGEGVKLERVSSIYAKVQNYKEALSLTKISPIFGVGFNNICLAKETFLQENETDSHACSGLDASLLFLLATTGVAGLFSFSNLISEVSRNLKKDIYVKALIACGLALFIHSLFANSLFYSWVMGFMTILGALAL